MRLVQIARARARSPGDAIQTDMQLVTDYIESGQHPVFNEQRTLYELSESGDVRDHPAFFQPRRGDVILLHYSIDFDHLEEILNWPVPVVMMYHNITPAHFLEPYDLLLAGKLRKARQDLERYLSRFRAWFAASEFSALELRNLGVAPVTIRPVAFRLPLTNGSIPRQRGHIIFVGRMFPNKNVEELIKIMFYISASLPEARLLLLGPSFLTSYVRPLKMLVSRLGLEGAIEFHGEVSEEMLNQAYSRADLFMTASVHEGFAVPVLEAMGAGIPVLASARSAAHGEKRAGVLYYGEDYPRIAEMAIRLIVDRDFREQIVADQNQALSEYTDPGNIHRFLSMILQHV
ncbi:MAG: glycosyltransferase family 4 protein [Spirochaetales bacterium]|nr:glycosyltransferase family 4 protein [Spirochaetales bacterium]